MTFPIFLKGGGDEFGINHYAAEGPVIMPGKIKKEKRKMKKEYYSFGGALMMHWVPENELEQVSVCSEDQVKEITCDCCGKHISQLKPFGKAGDPLRGDFETAYLVKTYRGYDDWSEKSWECRECIILDDDEYFRVIRTNSREQS